MAATSSITVRASTQKCRVHLSQQGLLVPARHFVSHRACLNTEMPGAPESAGLVSFPAGSSCAGHEVGSGCASCACRQGHVARRVCVCLLQLSVSYCVGTNGLARVPAVLFLSEVHACVYLSLRGKYVRS